MSSEETDDPHFVFVPPILDLLKCSYSPKLTFTTQIGQVRLIFQLIGLPEEHPLYLKPLVYVQWFKFPTCMNIDMNMHIMSQSLGADGLHRGEVVELRYVTQRIQLVPRFGACVSGQMTVNTSMEMDDCSYWVNSFFDKENYQAVY
jgi:hypothetical protein